MADRTSAALFAKVFRLLSRLSLEVEAREFWELSKDYDFQPYQMDCDDALERLGLARRAGDHHVEYEGEYED